MKLGACRCTLRLIVHFAPVMITPGIKFQVEIVLGINIPRIMDRERRRNPEVFHGGSTLHSFASMLF
jgi:hypothetical protein